jgi:hypothetical protein
MSSKSKALSSNPSIVRKKEKKKGTRKTKQQNEARGCFRKSSKR